MLIKVVPAEGGPGGPLIDGQRVVAVAETDVLSSVLASVLQAAGMPAAYPAIEAGRISSKTGRFHPYDPAHTLAALKLKQGSRLAIRRKAYGFDKDARFDIDGTPMHLSPARARAQTDAPQPPARPAAPKETAPEAPSPSVLRTRRVSLSASVHLAVPEAVRQCADAAAFAALPEEARRSLVEYRPIADLEAAVDAAAAAGGVFTKVHAQWLARILREAKERMSQAVFEALCDALVARGGRVGSLEAEEVRLVERAGDECLKAAAAACEDAVGGERWAQVHRAAAAAAAAAAAKPEQVEDENKEVAAAQLPAATYPPSHPTHPYLHHLVHGAARNVFSALSLVTQAPGAQGHAAAAAPPPPPPPPVAQPGAGSKTPPPPPAPPAARAAVPAQPQPAQATGPLRAAHHNLLAVLGLAGVTGQAPSLHFVAGLHTPAPAAAEEPCVAANSAPPVEPAIREAEVAKEATATPAALFTEDVQRLETDEEHVRERIFAAPFDDDAPWSPRSREQFAQRAVAITHETHERCVTEIVAAEKDGRAQLTPAVTEGLRELVVKQEEFTRAAVAAEVEASNELPARQAEIAKLLQSRKAEADTAVVAHAHEHLTRVAEADAPALSFLLGKDAAHGHLHAVLDDALKPAESLAFVAGKPSPAAATVREETAKEATPSALAVLTEDVQRLETDEEHVRERIFAAPFDDDAPWSPRSREQFVQRAVAITHETHERCVTEIVAAEKDGRAQLTPAVTEGLRELVVKQEEFTRAAVAAEVEASNELPARQAEIAKLLQSRKAEADTAVVAHAHEHLTRVAEADAPALSFLLGKDAAHGHLHAVLDDATKPAESLAFVAGTAEASKEATPSALAVLTEDVQRLETDEEHVRERIFAAPFDDDAPWSPRSREQFAQRAVAITHETHERCVTEIVAAEKDGRAQLTPAVTEGLRELVVKQEEFTRAAVAAEVEASNELPARQAEIAKLLQSRKAEADTAVVAHAHEHLTRVAEADAPALSFLLGKDAAHGHLHATLDVALKPAESLAFVAGKFSSADAAKEATATPAALFTEEVQRLETDEEHVRERIFAAPFDDDAPWSPRSREQFVQRAVAITHETHERCVTEIVSAEKDGRAQLTPAVTEGLRELIVKQEEFTRAAVAAEVEASNELPARQAEIAKLLQSRKAEADTAVVAHAHEHLTRVAEADAPALSFLLGKDAAHGHLHAVLDDALKPAESLAFVAGKPSPAAATVREETAKEATPSALAVLTEDVQRLETDEEHVRERIFAAPFDDDAPWSPRSREQFVQRAVAITHETHERCVTEIVAAEKDGRAQLTPAVTEGLRELVVKQEEFTRAAVAAEVEASNELPARQAEIAKLLQSRKAEADTAVVAHAHEHLTRVAEADAPALSFLLGKDAAHGHLHAVLDDALKPAESLAFVAGKSASLQDQVPEAAATSLLSTSPFAVLTEDVQRLETDEEQVRERIFAAPFDDDAPWSPRSREQFLRGLSELEPERDPFSDDRTPSGVISHRVPFTPEFVEGVARYRAADSGAQARVTGAPPPESFAPRAVHDGTLFLDVVLAVSDGRAGGLDFIRGTTAPLDVLYATSVPTPPLEQTEGTGAEISTAPVSPSALAVLTEEVQRLETDEEHVRERIFAAPFDDDAPWSPRSREQFVQRAVAITHETHERCVTEIVSAEKDGRAQLTPAVTEGLRELIVKQEEFTRAAVAAEVEASNELPARQAEIAKLLQSRKAEADTAVVAHAHEHLTQVVEGDAPALSFLLGKDAAHGHLHAVLHEASEPAQSLAFVAGKSPSPGLEEASKEATPSALAVLTEDVQRLETDEEHVRERIFAAPFDDDAPWSPRSREQFVQRAVAITHETHERCVTEIVSAEKDGRAQLTPAVTEGLRELVVKQEEFTRAAVAAEVEASNELPARQAEIAKLLQSRKAEADTAVVAHAHEHLTQILEGDAPALSFLLGKDAAHGHLHAVLDDALKPAESLAFVAGKPSPAAATVREETAKEATPSALAVLTEDVQRLETDEEHVRERIFAAPFDDDAPWSPRSREQFVQRAVAITHETHERCVTEIVSAEKDGRAQLTPAVTEGLRELVVKQEEFTRAAVAAEVEASNELPARQAEIAKLLQSRKAEADTAVVAHAHEHLTRVAEADAPALSFLLAEDHAHLHAVVNGAPTPTDSLAFIAKRLPVHGSTNVGDASSGFVGDVLPAAAAAPPLLSTTRPDPSESARESLHLVNALGDGAALDFICQRRPAIVLPVGAPTCVASYDRETESGAQVCLCLRQCDIVRDTPETLLATRGAEWRCLVGEGVTYFRHCWSKKKVRNLAKEINKGVLTPSQELKHLAEWSYSKKKECWKNDAAKKKCSDRCDVLREVAKVTAADSPYPHTSRVAVSPEAARAIGRCLAVQAKRFGEWERRRVEKAAQRVIVLDAKQLETHALESGKWKAKPIVGSDKQFFQKGKEKVRNLGEHLVTVAQDKCRLKAGVDFYPPDCTKCSARYAMPPPRWECPRDKTMVWQPDGAMSSKFCHTCKKDVSKQRGQDHCRRCGHISCRTCIAHEMPLVGMGWSGATHLKVCKPCADVPRDL